MRVLRSREIRSLKPSPSTSLIQAPPAPTVIGPPTPAKILEPSSTFSSSPTPPDFRSGSGSPGPRRSFRLAAQSGVAGARVVDSVKESRRSGKKKEPGNGLNNGSGSEFLSENNPTRKSTKTLKIGGKMNTVFDLNQQPQTSDDEKEANEIDKRVLLGSVESGSSGSPQKNANPSVVASAVPSDSAVTDTGNECLLKLRSGRRVTKRRIDVIDVSDSTDEGEGEEIHEKVDLHDSKPSLIVKTSSSCDKRQRYSRIEKGKAVCNSEEHQTLDLISLISGNEGQIKVEKRNGELKIDDRDEANDEGLETRPIVIEDGEEKDEDLSIADLLLSIAETWEKRQPPRPASLDRDSAGEEFIWPPPRNYMEENKGRFLETAKYFASKHARFNRNEDRQGSSPAKTEAAQAIEDWPGPFSTAMKIIKDRQEKLNSRQVNSASGGCKLRSTIDWTPRNKSDFVPLRKSAPSLVNLCITALCKDAEHISSLDCVPEVFRSKLSQMLCDSGRMNSLLLPLFVSGCPSEVCVKNCSAITEEQLKEIMGLCDFNKLEVLQLDLSGRCISDYLLHDTLACTPNKLPLLVSVSLKCAYRLTDGGIRALVTAAPSLTSINFSGCSLVTSDGITTVADNLGSLLKEMYLDDCQGIDAMSVFPALEKLKCLEVLSVARIQTVSDEFVHELVSSCGSHMKELDFSGCRNLTDTSLAAIAQKCKGLISLNLTSLHKLTDASLLYICNGCCDLQVLKLRQNEFSDEAVAAFVEVGGQKLREFSLNGVKQVTNNTAIAIASYCSSSLKVLDLSWCHKLDDEALGFIVDKCISLRVLKLFGCSQVTNMFLDGHSNFNVKIIGVKLSPVTEDLDMADYLSPY